MKNSMRIIIKIKAEANGVHRDQAWNDTSSIPDGYVLLPEGEEVQAAYEAAKPFMDLELDENGVLVGITALDKPEETATETPIDAVTQTQIALAELAEVEAAHDLENKLALAELAEVLTGG